MKPNYAFNPIAEQALRSNQTTVPQRVNAALGFRSGFVGNWRSYLKVYYCGVLILFTFSILTGLEEPMDVVNALISAFVFVGAYGFLAKVAIGSRGFWQVYFWLFALSTLASVVVGAWSLREEMTVGLMLVMLFAVTLWLPMFMVIWLYAFVDQEPWKNPRPET